VILGHACELRNRGDYLWSEEEGVAAYRGNGLIVFDGRCPHRGARLFDRPAGNKELSCPYHGWRPGGIQIAEKSWFWRGGWIWMDQPPAIAAVIAGIEVAEVAIPEQRIEYACDWRVAVENALECTHTPHVHAETLGKMEFEEGATTYLGSSSIAGLKINSKTMREALLALREAFGNPVMLADYLSIFIYPHTFITSTFGMTYSLNKFLPVNGRTIFTSKTYSTVPVKGRVRAYVEAQRAFNAKVFEEDRLICERVGEWRQGPLLAGEERLRHFRENL
jgi:hypothetical protein